MPRKEHGARYKPSVFPNSGVDGGSVLLRHGLVMIEHWIEGAWLPGKLPFIVGGISTPLLKATPRAFGGEHTVSRRGAQFAGFSVLSASPAIYPAQPKKHGPGNEEETASGQYA